MYHLERNDFFVKMFVLLLKPGVVLLLPSVEVGQKCPEQTNIFENFNSSEEGTLQHDSQFVLAFTLWCYVDFQMYKRGIRSRNSLA